MIPVCAAYGAVVPKFIPEKILGANFFRNKFPFPKKGTTPRRTWYTKKISRVKFGNIAGASLDKIHGDQVSEYRMFGASAGG